MKQNSITNIHSGLSSKGIAKPHVIGCSVLINALRKADFYVEHLFMMGSCYRFHLFLKEIYPEAVPYLHQDKDHVVSKIDGRLYDIKGAIKKKHECLYSPLKEEDLAMVKRWSFSKNNLLKLSECPNCEEPLCYSR